MSREPRSVPELWSWPRRGGRRVKAAGIRAPEAASRYVLGLGFVLKGLCLLPVGATEGADGDGEL